MPASRPSHVYSRDVELYKGTATYVCRLLADLVPDRASDEPDPLTPSNPAFRPPSARLHFTSIITSTPRHYLCSPGLQMTSDLDPLPEEHDGPCWVVLGGSTTVRGIHMQSQ